MKNIHIWTGTYANGHSTEHDSTVSKPQGAWLLTPFSWPLSQALTTASVSQMAPRAQLTC